MTAPHMGGCLCGNIRYIAEGPPNNVTNCHCRTCQQATGTAMVTWAEFPREAVSWERGEVRWRRSSDKGERGFCPACGTPLTFRYLESLNVDLAVATMDDPDRLPPEDELWTQSRFSWMPADERLPQYRRSRQKG